MKNQSIIRKPRENLQNIFSFSVLIWMGQSEHLRWGQIRFCFGFFVGSDVWRPTHTEVTFKSNSFILVNAYT